MNIGQTRDTKTRKKTDTLSLGGMKAVLSFLVIVLVALLLIFVIRFTLL